MKAGQTPYYLNFPLSLPLPPFFVIGLNSCIFLIQFQFKGVFVWIPYLLIQQLLKCPLFETFFISSFSLMIFMLITRIVVSAYIHDRYILIPKRYKR